jgi:hypothetical protein
MAHYLHDDDEAKQDAIEADQAAREIHQTVTVSGFPELTGLPPNNILPGRLFRFLWRALFCFRSA